ncbi:hypothetical protein TNCV_1510731 [Trichonephila clavipes]|nr:hypothetical protein TNCV_1510731 [Trichonephila clavipes]
MKLYGQGREVVAGDVSVVPDARILIPLKTCREASIMHVKSVGASSSQIGEISELEIRNYELRRQDRR